MDENDNDMGREDALADRERELDVRHDDLRAREGQADEREGQADEREGQADERDRRVDERERLVAERGESSPRVSNRYDLEPGTVIADRWRVDALVARGGAGTVWRATDLRLGRVVAVKLMHTELLDDGKALQRFRREASLLARVEHEHVMRLFDVETLGDQLCLVAEYVGGMSLRELIGKYAPFPAGVIASLGLQLAHGVAAIHAQGVVHRDLKPRNVVLTDRGTLKIVDFGTARHLTAELTPGPTGHVAGSPAYLAPEQVEGRLGDKRTDLYALGLILWEAATGRRPFAGDTNTATALARLTAEVPDLPDEGGSDARELADVVRRLTRIAPQRRYRTAWEVVDALSPIAPARPIDLLAALQQEPPA